LFDESRRVGGDGNDGDVARKALMKDGVRQASKVGLSTLPCGITGTLAFDLTSSTVSVLAFDHETRYAYQH
jgi:hypothetical protein